MNRPTFRLVVLAVTVATVTMPAAALGPLDGEAGAVWWHNDFDSSGGTTAVSTDAGAPGYHAELWLLNRYGLRATRFTSDLDDLGMDQTDSTSVDLMWKIVAPTERNYLALGAGWQQTDLDAIGLGDSTSGVRLSVEGRVSLVGIVEAYGQGSYLPSLDDADAAVAAAGRFEDMKAQEYEVGVGFKTMPFLSIRAGYRVQTLDFTRRGFDTLDPNAEISGDAESSGFLLGLTARF